MKIEKLNDNQIRCILDKNDLTERQLKLSELAYGSPKAKELFHDMIEQAAAEFGFEAENMPLMIEAIPVSFDCLILVVTKVDDPEELDTRFSRFTSLSDTDKEELINMQEDILGDDEPLPFNDDGIIDMENMPADNKDNAETPENPSFDFGASLLDSFEKMRQEVLKKKKGNSSSRVSADRVFIFDNLDQVLNVSSLLAPFYTANSRLYKDPVQEDYYLLLLREDIDDDLYLRACNLCSDFGYSATASYATPAYFNEHFRCICQDQAIQSLNHINS